jgi:hypothetical protein
MSVAAGSSKRCAEFRGDGTTGTAMGFRTTATGTTSRIERMRNDNTGNGGIS